MVHWPNAQFRITIWFQDVTKGLVKAIEAAEQTKHRVNAIHEKQHERLQKRVERQHSKRKIKKCKCLVE